MKLLIMTCISIILCQAVMAQEEKPMLRGISLSVQDKMSVFGRDVPILVRYYNEDEGMWSIAAPEQSTAVYVRFRRTSTDTHPGGYSLAPLQISTTLTEDGTTIIAYISPVPEKIDIEANASHQFTIMFVRDWTGNVTPGRWTVWIKDNNVNLESNRLEITLYFTNDSIAACLAIARDKDANVSRRRWHAEYLQKVMPDLHLRWWHMPPNDPEPEEQERLEQAIQREWDRFEAFWKDEANAPAINAAIDRINREAGLERNDTNGDNSKRDD